MRKYLSQGEPPKWIVAALALFAIVIYALLPLNLQARQVSIGSSDLPYTTVVDWDTLIISGTSIISAGDMYIPLNLAGTIDTLSGNVYRNRIQGKVVIKNRVILK